MLMNGSRYEVIGVMPRAFVFRNRDVDYWIPISFSPAAAAVRTSHFLNVVARLAPGVALDAAKDDMRRVDEALRQQYPEPGRHAHVPARADQGRTAGQHARAAPRPDGRGGRGAADRVREPREPAAVARGRPPRRDGRARRARRDARPSGPADGRRGDDLLAGSAAPWGSRSRRRASR